MDRPVTREQSVAFAIREVVVRWSGEGKIEELLTQRVQGGHWNKAKVPHVIAGCLYVLICRYKYSRTKRLVLIEKISIKLANSTWACLYDLEKGLQGSVNGEGKNTRFYLQTEDLRPLVALLREQEQRNVMHELVLKGASAFDEIDGEEELCDLAAEMPLGLEPVAEADDDLLPSDLD